MRVPTVYYLVCCSIKYALMYEYKVIYFKYNILMFYEMYLFKGVV